MLDYLLNLMFSRYIVYTKIFQWINFDNFWFIGKTLNCYMRKFTNNAPYIKSDIDYETIQLLRNNAEDNEYVIEINETPINSGTLSLVFKGTLNTNGITTNIAVKILRTNIRNKIISAIDNIEFVISFLKYFPFISNIRLDEFFLNVKNELLEQVDFDKEMKSIQSMYNISKNYGKIKPTNVIDKLCGDNYLTMIFIDGKSLFELTPNKKEEFIDTMCSALLYLTFNKSTFHMDLHPGNILFIEENGKNKICLLDMGMVASLTHEENNLLFGLIEIFYDEYNKQKFYSFLRNNIGLFTDDEIDIDVFLNVLFIKNPNLMKIKTINNIALDVGTLIYEFNSQSYNVKPRVHKLLLGFVSFLGICDSLDVNGNFRKTLINKMKS